MSAWPSKLVVSEDEQDLFLTLGTPTEEGTEPATSYVAWIKGKGVKWEDGEISCEFDTDAITQSGATWAPCRTAQFKGKRVGVSADGESAVYDGTLDVTTDFAIQSSAA